MSGREDKGPPGGVSLTRRCLRAVRRLFPVLDPEAVLELPVPLIMDLLPHLTVCQLTALQPALNLRGISTLCGWLAVLQDYHGSKYVPSLYTENKAKHEVMRLLFPLVFYGFMNPYIQQNLENLNTPSFLHAAAECTQRFLVLPRVQRCLHRLTSEQRPFLSVLEKNIHCLDVSHFDFSDRKVQTALYVLHRLLDHGGATKLVLSTPPPTVLAWMLQGRGCGRLDLELSSSSPAGHPDVPFKCRRMDLVEEECGTFPVDPEDLCRAFAHCDAPSADVCPRGHIECLEMLQCDSLTVLNLALPTFCSLGSLKLHSSSIFKDSEVLELASALKQLSGWSCSSLSVLSVSILPNAGLMRLLLDSCNRLTELHLEIQTVTWGEGISLHEAATSDVPAELPLQNLTVKVEELQTDWSFLTSVLRRCPQLSSLHLAGMRLPTGSSQKPLLTTISESNRCLRTLHLEDLKLSDCLPHILHLLRDCMLEDLHLIDCRLLEECEKKEESLQQLVSALKRVTSLRSLSLAQNRLARSVCVLVELLSGSSSSSVNHLNISSNFIQPAELLEFAERLTTDPPPHPLTLDLRRNPGDRDPDTWSTALKMLRPFSVLLVEGWRSTDTMVDHVSNM